MPVEPLSLTLTRADAVQQLQTLLGAADRAALAGAARASVESARAADGSVNALDGATAPVIQGDAEGSGEGAPERREPQTSAPPAGRAVEDPIGRGRRVDLTA